MASPNSVRRLVSGGAGQVCRRTLIIFGLSYLFWLVFYFDFLKKSIKSVATLVEPSAIIVVPLVITGLAIAIAVIVAAVTLKVSNHSFVRGVVIAGVLLNLSSLISIGLSSPLAWVSLVLSVAALVAVWKVPAVRVANAALLCGVVVTGYALIDQGLWAWSFRLKPEPASTQATPSFSANVTLPSVYVVVMDEFPLNLINKYTSFMSLPNLSRLAKEGIFFPRAYAVSDTTEWSIPAFFTGSYLEQDQVSGRASHLSLTKYRNLVTDLASLGYRVKVFNDLFGISDKVPCSPLKVDMEGSAVVSRDGLNTFAIKHLVRQVTFGLRPAPNIGSYLHGQPARVFHLEHQRDQPQLVYIHLFDAHQDWVHNRDGSFHHSPYASFADPWDGSAAAKVADNMFEQYLWADNVAGQLVDALLSIPPEERIVVFLSDHGISWREPPFGRETGFLSTAQVHVPVVLAAPGLSPGINPDLLPLIDLYPTIVDLLNKAASKTVLTPPENIDGLSLFGESTLRQNRPHYAFTASSKYRLTEDKWVLEKTLATKSITGWQWSEFPSPAQELALTPEAVQRAVEEATSLQPIPPMDPNRMRSREQPANPTLVLVYSDYQIFLYKGRYYGIRQDEAKDAPQRLRAGDFSNTIEGISLDDVKQKIDALPLEHKGFMLISAEGIIYGFPKPDGPLEEVEIYLEHIKANKIYPVYTGKTIEEVTSAIDSNPYVGGAGDSLILVEEGYQGFNIVANKGTLYAILQTDGAFDYQRLKNGPYTVVLPGRTLEEVKKAIDDYKKNPGGT